MAVGSKSAVDSRAAHRSPAAPQFLIHFSTVGQGAPFGWRRRRVKHRLRRRLDNPSASGMSRPKLRRKPTLCASGKTAIPVTPVTQRPQGPA